MVVPNNHINEANILIIEDDLVLRHSMVDYLRNKGCAVIGEYSSNGLATARSVRPDLVICDLNTEVVNGHNLVYALHDEIPDTPVILLSNASVLSEAIESLCDWVWDFITKPIANMVILSHAVNATLERARLTKNNLIYQRELEEANRTLREHLERFEQDAVAGRKTQSQLMPPEDITIENYRFTRRSLPCLYLTGDFADYFTIKPGYIGFLFADASGHGAAPAFITVLLKSFIERYRRNSDDCLLQPSRTLALLDQDLKRQRLDRYMTIFYGVINNHNHTLCYSCGGHFPYPILYNGQSSYFLDAKGPPVGMFLQPTFADTMVVLPKSHALIVLSDGILDAMPDTKLKDKKTRLLNAIDRCGPDTDSLWNALDIKINVSYPDDITILIAKQE